MKTNETIIFKNQGKIIKKIYWISNFSTTSEEICLTDYIEKNSQNLRQKLLAILENLEIQNKSLIDKFKIEPNFNFWFLTNFREKNFYKNNEFFEITKVISIIDIVKEINFDEINININNKNYRDCLVDIFKTKNVNISFHKTSVLKQNKQLLNEFINLGKGIKFLISKLFYKKRNVETSSTFNLFVSFFTYINKKKFNEKKYDSLFWSNINSLCNSNFLHIFLNNEISNNINYLSDTIKTFNNKNEFHGFLDTNINIIILIKIFFISLKIKYKSILNLNNFELTYNTKKISRFVSYNLQQEFLFYNILIKIYYFYLFKVYFNKNKFSSKCFYIHENQPWEKSLIYHWRKNNKNKIYGVINSSIRFWDLRFQKSQISPDYLLTNGDDSHDKALNFGYDRDELIKVESLRYKNTKKPLFSKFKNSILIVLDYSNKSNSALIEILNEFIDLSKYQIFFKEHPLNKNKNFKTIFSYEIIENNKQFEDYDLVICTNKTAVSIDYFSKGYNVAILKESNFFNFSPLKDNQNCSFFRNSRELLNIIKSMNEKKTKRYKTNFFLIDIEYKKWKNLLNERE